MICWGFECFVFWLVLIYIVWIEFLLYVHCWFWVLGLRFGLNFFWYCLCCCVLFICVVLCTLCATRFWGSFSDLVVLLLEFELFWGFGYCVGCAILLVGWLVWWVWVLHFYCFWRLGLVCSDCVACSWLWVCFYEFCVGWVGLLVCLVVLGCWFWVCECFLCWFVFARFVLGFICMIVNFVFELCFL